MDNIKLISILLVFSIGILHFASCFRCYQCSYVGAEVYDGYGQQECLSEDTLLVSMLHKCSRNTTTLSIIEEGRRWPVEQAPVGCITFKGIGTSEDVALSAVLRDCLPSFGDLEFETGCERKSLALWRVEDDFMSTLVASVFKEFSPNSMVEACYCQEDKCNGWKSEDGEFESHSLIS